MNFASSLSPTSNLSKIVKLCALSLGLSVAMSGAWAKSDLNEKLSDVSIKDRGELTLDAKGNIDYKPWSTANLESGVVTIVMHLPARYSSEKDINPLRYALEAKGYSDKTLRSINVVNLDDAMFGASAFIGGELKKNKIDQPKAIFVVDEDGTALENWELKKKRSFVIVTDQNNTVRYKHSGKYDDAEAAKVIALIDELNKASVTVDVEAATKLMVE